MTRAKTPVHVVIDDVSVAKTNDPMVVIDPVWWSADTGGGLLSYERSLEKFTYAQRYVFAAIWYASEVFNGGHSQFYSNSTGIVWRDAMDGLAVMGIDDVHEIVTESVRRFGAAPSSDCDERNEQLAESGATFEDLDERFYASDAKSDFMTRLMNYIHEHPSEFRFSGVIQRPSNWS